MATLKQIAERCGVSLSTVSKALNGAEDVSRDTMLRIREVAKEMGYMPNAAARALKTSRSYCFGLLMADSVSADMPHEFFVRIIVSFKSRASELGYDIISISNHLGGRKIDVVIANNGSIGDDVAGSYEAENKSLVTLDMKDGVIADDIIHIDEAGSVRHDTLKTAYMIFSYLMKLPGGRE